MPAGWLVLAARAYQTVVVALEATPEVLANVLGEAGTGTPANFMVPLMAALLAPEGRTSAETADTVNPVTPSIYSHDGRYGLCAGRCRNCVGAGIHSCSASGFCQLQRITRAVVDAYRYGIAGNRLDAGTGWRQVNINRAAATKTYYGADV